MKIALVQLSSGDDWRANLRSVETYVRKASRRGASAVCFPENSLYRGNPRNLRTVAKEIRHGRPWAALSDLAKKFRIAILLGGYPELKRGSRKVFNTAIWIDEKGKILARYRKIHLFDAVTPGGKRYMESSAFLSGKRLKVFRWKGIRIGLAICYDLRFPEQFRALVAKGAEWIFLPSAFTRETGRDHWHTLLRARAIENLATVLAPAQTGRDSSGTDCFGHSVIFGPWGEFLGGLSRREGLLIADLDPGPGRRLRGLFDAWKSS